MRPSALQTTQLWSLLLNYTPDKCMSITSSLLHIRQMQVSIPLSLSGGGAPDISVYSTRTNVLFDAASSHV